MKKLSRIIITFGATATLSGCTLFQIDYTSIYNPTNLLAKNSYSGYLYLDDYENPLNDSGNVIKQAIVSIDKYSNIGQSKMQTTGNMFRYYIEPNGLFLLITRGGDFTFYDNGYVAVKPLPDGNTKDCYYYQFDADEAAKLYDKVVDTFEEDARQREEMSEVEHEYNETINGFEKDFIMEKLDQYSPVEISFSYLGQLYLDTYRCNLTDDGTVVEMIKNAQYTDYSRSSNKETTDYSNRISISKTNENGDTWSYELSEGTGVATFKRLLIDKFQRAYRKELTYLIDRTSLHNIMDKVIEMREQYFENRSNSGEGSEISSSNNG